MTTGANGVQLNESAAQSTGDNDKCTMPDLVNCHSVNEDYESSKTGEASITHTRDDSWKIDLGGNEVTMYSRKRTFNLATRDNWTANISAIINGELCGTKTDADNYISARENSVQKEATLFYVNPSLNVYFWREREDTVKFGKGSSAMVKFRGGMFGTSWLHKLVVGDVKNKRVEKYYLSVNGAKEEIEVVESEWVIYDHLIIVYPNPSSGQGTQDEEIRMWGFYDYPGAIEDPEDTRGKADGGHDFYYPDWLKPPRDTAYIDEGIAGERYFKHYLANPGQGLPPTPDIPFQFSLPRLPYGVPRGNAAKNEDGEMAVSFRAETKYVNRLYNSDGTYKDITSLFNTDKGIYPVSLV